MKKQQGMILLLALLVQLYGVEAEGDGSSSGMGFMQWFGILAGLLLCVCCIGGGIFVYMQRKLAGAKMPPGPPQKPAKPEPVPSSSDVQVELPLIVPEAPLPTTATEISTFLPTYDQAITISGAEPTLPPSAGPSKYVIPTPAYGTGPAVAPANKLAQYQLPTSSLPAAAFASGTAPAAATAPPLPAYSGYAGYAAPSNALPVPVATLPPVATNALPVPAGSVYVSTAPAAATEAISSISMGPPVATLPMTLQPPTSSADGPYMLQPPIGSAPATVPTPSYLLPGAAAAGGYALTPGGAGGYGLAPGVSNAATELPAGGGGYSFAGSPTAAAPGYSFAGGPAAAAAAPPMTTASSISYLSPTGNPVVGSPTANPVVEGGGYVFLPLSPNAPGPMSPAGTTTAAQPKYTFNPLTPGYGGYGY